MTDTLTRFLAPQERDYPGALAEIRAGHKRGHWIWYVFPQLAGLGRSERSEHYGLAGRQEAAAWLAHPVLGPHLVDISEALLVHRGTPTERILGGVDARKVQSCATLFAALPGAPRVFDEILDAFYGGRPCPETQRRLA